VGNPKAAYAICFVTGRDGDSVYIGETCFRSRALAHNLKSVEQVLPLLATCGHEMDQRAPDKGDMLQEFWWDVIKAHLLAAASAYLSDHMHRRFRLSKTAIMRPGSGDASVLPIEQQKDLFALLGDVGNERRQRPATSSAKSARKNASKSVPAGCAGGRHRRTKKLDGRRPCPCAVDEVMSGANGGGMARSPSVVDPAT